MRKLTKTHTGTIATDTDLNLEYLYVGDYGKENNIKADFLGYTKRIDKVENKPVNFKQKLVITVSSQHGCPMKCNFCDCPKLGFSGNATLAELMSEINAVEIGRLYKYNGGFKFQAIGQGYLGGMTELFKNFGLDIDEGTDD